jgi:hypothetical protein
MIERDSVEPATADLIDRLVDGTLTPAELRAAIERLGAEPDGWKRCALAFLEAQCWRHVFRASDETSGGEVPRVLSISLPTMARRERPRTRPMRVAAAAAVAAASFALGWLARPAGPLFANRHPPTPMPVTVAIRLDQREPPPGTLGALDPTRSARQSDLPPSEDRFPPDPSEAIQTVARVWIGTEGASAPVPILAGPGITEDWVRDQPPPLSEHRQALLERQGFQVDQQRRLVTTTLSDGRLVTIPVDQVVFQYTGNNSL